jgi:hypothetical protein
VSATFCPDCGSPIGHSGECSLCIEADYARYQLESDHREGLQDDAAREERLSRPVRPPDLVLPEEVLADDRRELRRIREDREAEAEYYRRLER